MITYQLFHFISTVFTKCPSHETLNQHSESIGTMVAAIFFSSKCSYYLSVNQFVNGSFCPTSLFIRSLQQAGVIVNVCVCVCVCVCASVPLLRPIYPLLGVGVLKFHKNRFLVFFVLPSCIGIEFCSKRKIVIMLSPDCDTSDRDLF